MRGTKKKTERHRQSWQSLEVVVLRNGWSGIIHPAPSLSLSLQATIIFFLHLFLHKYIYTHIIQSFSHRVNFSSSCLFASSHLHSLFVAKHIIYIEFVFEAWKRLLVQFHYFSLSNLKLDPVSNSAKLRCHQIPFLVKPLPLQTPTLSRKGEISQEIQVYFTITYYGFSLI